MCVFVCLLPWCFFQGVEDTAFSIRLDVNARVSGFAGWFTADFHGTEEIPCPCPVTLATGPEDGNTHWGQQVRKKSNKKR